MGGNGGDSAMGSSELWYQDSENEAAYTVCNLPSLPERRFHGTLNGLKYCCGGSWDFDAPWRSCIEFDQGSWITTNTNLTPRWYHTSWETGNGIYLIGGESNNGQWTTDQAKTTTLVKSDGSSAPGGFSMNSNAVLVFFLDFNKLHKTCHFTRGSCAIPDGDSVVIISGGTDVTRYNETGFVENLPSLNNGRGFASCVGYVNNQSETVFIFP